MKWTRRIVLFPLVFLSLPAFFLVDVLFHSIKWGWYRLREYVINDFWHGIKDKIRLYKQEIGDSYYRVYHGRNRKKERLHQQFNILANNKNWMSGKAWNVEDLKKSTKWKEIVEDELKTSSS